MPEPLYPPAWDRLADVRVMRAPADDWGKLAVWRSEMQRKGFKLLRVTTEQAQLVAVFGRTRTDASRAD